MNEWGVFLVIVALVGFVASIYKPIVTLNNNITELTVTMKNLGEDLRKLEASNHDGHKRLWDKSAEQDETLSNHETRITLLEKK